MRRCVVLAALLMGSALCGCRSSKTSADRVEAFEDVRRAGVAGMWRSLADSLRLEIVVTIDSPKVVVGEPDRPKAVLEGRRLTVAARGSADVSDEVSVLSSESLDSHAETLRSQSSESRSQPSASPQKALLALGLLVAATLFIKFCRKC